MIPYELFHRCTVGSLEEFGAEFSTCARAFRLELLDTYTEDTETRFFRLYEAGQTECPEEFNSDWLNTLAAAKSRGAEFRRVRFLSTSPLTPYIEFELDWGYRRNIAAGEQIRAISNVTLDKLVGLTGMAVDFWLFDESRCYLVMYVSVGRFLGVVRTLNKDVALFVEASDLAWKESEQLK